jgi:hypothetical protein
MTHSVPAIESFLPEVGSPLFHDAVEEVVSIMETFPAASYEQAVCHFLVKSFFLSTENYDDNDSWYESSASASASTEVAVVEQKESFFVANKVSEEVNRFLQGQFPAGPKVAACTGGNRCSSASCQLFHGPLCEFHAGMKVHFGGPKRGQKMTCGKGLACPFDHASAELRSARVAAGLQEKRFRHAPKLATEADILSVFPSMIWRFSDVYTYENLSSAEMDLLEVCLERSAELEVVPLQGGLQIATTDFMDSRDLPSPPPFVAPPPSAADGWEVAAPRRR